MRACQPPQKNGGGRRSPCSSSPLTPFQWQCFLLSSATVKESLGNRVGHGKNQSHLKNIVSALTWAVRGLHRSALRVSAQPLRFPKSLRGEWRTAASPSPLTLRASFLGAEKSPRSYFHFSVKGQNAFWRLLDVHGVK